MIYKQHRPILVVFAGLPGTGKTSIARKLTNQLGATYLRIDAIEQALHQAGLTVGPAGYAIARALAAENLKLGRIVVADCVNPVLASRTGWRQTASQNAARLVEIELVCSDPALHRKRVESRLPDIDGHKLPAWDDIVRQYYEPWDRAHLVLDTATGTLDDLVAQAESHVRAEVE